MPGVVTLALVVSAKGRCDPRPFVEALQAAGALDDPQIELHVVQDAGSEWIAPAPRLPVRRLSETASVFHLWGYGASLAQAAHVAILDIHCPPAPGWFEAVRARLAADPSAFYGPVEPGYPANDLRIIGYLTEYVQFHRPVEREMSEVAGVNLVLRRALMGDPAHLRTEGFVKTLALHDLREAGVERVDAAVVLHRKPFELSAYVRRRYRHGRGFAAQRRAQPGAPPALAAALFTPLLPLLRVWRIHGHARRIPACRAAFWRFWPQILAAETGWSVGELMGYLAGEGDVRARLD